MEYVLQPRFPAVPEEVAGAESQYGGYFITQAQVPPLSKDGYLSQTVYLRAPSSAEPEYYYWEEQVIRQTVVWYVTQESEAVWRVRVHSCGLEDISQQLQEKFRRFVDRRLTDWDQALAKLPNLSMEDMGLGWVAAGVHLQIRAQEPLPYARAAYQAEMAQRSQASGGAPIQEEHRQPCRFQEILQY